MTQIINDNLIGSLEHYVPEEQAEKIKAIRKLGIKVCLFICRTENESLPVEAGKYWVSGDRVVKGSFPPGRIHLWADFTNEEHLKIYYGLFEIVVIDQSSAKLLGTDFISRCVKLLYPSQDATFIFENDFSIEYLEDYVGT